MEAKRKEKEAPVAASNTLGAKPNISYSAGEGLHGDRAYEPGPETVENVEEREERSDEDVRMAEAGAEAQEEEEQEEQEEQEEADEDFHDDIADEPEVVDTLELEETELLKDQKGLEERVTNESESVEDR